METKNTQYAAIYHISDIHIDANRDAEYTNIFKKFAEDVKKDTRQKLIVF